MPGNMTVSLRINADGSAAITSLKQVEGAVGSLGQKGKASSAGIESLTSSLKSLAITATAALTVERLAASFMSANMEASKFRAQLVTATGSVEQANRAWSALQGFAANTPYSLAEATQAFVTLKNRGLDASIASMTSYGNTASALGKSLPQMAEAVADAITGDFARAQEAFGVNAQQMGAKVAMTFRGVTTVIGNNAKEIQAYFQGLGNVEFAGGMERQSKTLIGLSSTLKDSWIQLMVAIGDTGPTESISNAMSGATSILDEFTLSVQQGMLVGELGARFAQAGADIGAFGAAASSAASYVESMANAVANIPVYAPVIEDGTVALQEQGPFWDVIKEKALSLGDTILAMPDYFTKAVIIINGEVDVLTTYFTSGMNMLPPAAQSAWADVQSYTATAMSRIQELVGAGMAYVRQQIASLLNIASEIPDIAGGGGSGRADDGTQARIDGIRAETQARLDAVDAAARHRQEQANLDAEFARAVGDEAKLERQVKLTTSAHEKGAVGVGKHADAIKKAGGAHNSAAAEAKKYESELNSLIARFLPARAEAENLAKATAILDKAQAKGDITAAEYAQAIAKIKDAYEGSGSAAQRLIDEYDREGAQTRKLAADRAELNRIIEEGGSKAEGARVALANLTKEEQANSASGKVWAEMWTNAVRRIDDTFSGLWEDLITGTRSTLDSLKEMMLKWLAEVSYQMLLKPIVVGITTSLLGGTAGATGATGAMGAASNLVGPSNITSLFSTAWSLGATFLEGVAAGFSSMFSGTVGTALSFAWAGATSGTASGMAAGLGVGSAYLLPLIAIAGFAISKFFEDQEPRYGAWSATVGNNPRGLEDWENGPDNYAKGGFGLTFGLSDNGSKNMDASEFKDTYQAFADITKMLENFFGKDLSAKIKAGLEKAAAENWTRDGVMRLAGNESVEAAFKGMIDMIADQAAITGEHLGVAFEYALGDLTGTAEEMANQVQIAMLTAAAYTLIADEWNSHMGEMMALTGDFGADIRILGGYVEAFSNDGENAAQTLARIAAEISALEYSATITTTAIEGLSGTALIQMAEDLADAFGNIDVAIQALAFYGQNFQHAGELFAIQARAAMEQINRIWKDLDFGEAEQIIPATRDEFTALIKGLDLTTESGRELFAELMKLSPMFDTLFDSMDAFVEWLSPADKTKLALERITGVFEEMGIKLPNTLDELLKLYESGGLTIEQMAVLGAYLDELKTLFGDVGDNVVDLTEKLAAQRLNLLDLAEQLDPTPYGSHDRIMQAEQALRDAGYTGDIFDAKRIAEFIRAIAELEDAGGDAGAKLIKFAKDFEQVFDDIARIASEKADLNIRLLTLMGKDEEVLALQRQREMDAIDKSNRWILKRIYALEDEQRALEKRKDEERKRVEDEYQSRMDAIQDEREALDEAHQAQMEALSKQRDAANEALSAANGLLNSIHSALNSIRGSQPVDEFSRIRAQRQMAAWAASGTLPEQEALDRALGTISRTSANDFASESAYRLSKQTDYANLLVLEGLAGDKVDWAEKTVESLDKQAEMLDDYYQQSLDALDKQAEMVSDWRDAQLERIDKLVINSDDILTKLDWLNPGAATGPVMVGANNGGDFQALRDEIAGLRADLAAIGTAQVTPLKSIDERLRKFDNDGMPPSRDGEVLLRAA